MGGSTQLILWSELLNHLRITYKSPKNNLRFTREFQVKKK